MKYTRQELVQAQKDAEELLRKSQVELDENYNNYKTDFYDRLEKYDTTEDKMQFILHDLREFRQTKIKSAAHFHKTLTPEERLNTRNFHVELLDDLIELLENHYKNLEEISKIEGLSVTLNRAEPKMKWNGQKNILIDLFYQLKRINNDKGDPLIPNSNEDIADFLKQNFSCFEETQFGTILQQLNSSKRPKKNEKRLLISK